MVQELIDLRNCIEAQRYDQALMIIDELEGMGKQAILRNIQSYLLRLLIHLIKNQIEQRLTNSWAASIRGSIREIQKLNLKDNKKSYYIQQDEWQTWLEDSLEDAIRDASVEVMNGTYTPFKLSEIVERDSILMKSQSLLDLTYRYPAKELAAQVDQTLIELPGGTAWKN
ncbi:conserved hypothetical protein [Planktothrix sp. PCC 11201]|uniref:DUF29 family protein n=1 Tax=Planktothrix sp. PCC 11201 TaxID=1729650 RepID=UPI00091451B8|nr:DUF29 family protein [Planktothrix sp. PCC 11201]SKB15389.1 conserved hypothetical protein [Planktothrix sp. PCC 11201]